MRKEQWLHEQEERDERENIFPNRIINLNDWNNERLEQNDNIRNNDDNHRKNQDDAPSNIDLYYTMIYNNIRNNMNERNPFTFINVNQSLNNARNQ